VLYFNNEEIYFCIANFRLLAYLDLTVVATMVGSLKNKDKLPKEDDEATTREEDLPKG
jgi:hypothetical protein